MNRDVQALVLLALGTAGMTTSVTGTYSAYVKPSLLPYLIASSLVLIVLALAPYVTELRRGPAAAPAGDGSEPVVHDHHESGRVAWLLLLPTLVLMLIAPPALGAAASERDSGVVTAADLDLARLPPIPDTDPAELTLLDVAMRAGFENAGGLAGRRVTVVGFAEPHDGGWYLSRISIACCAADALAVKVDAKGAPAPAADSWVEVTGTVEATTAGQPPDLIVESVVPVAEPDSPYLLRGGFGL